MGARADMRAQVPGGETALRERVAMRCRKALSALVTSADHKGGQGYEKGGPEGPPLLCGIIPAGWQAAMPGQFFQDQAFWKTSSPSRTSIRTA